MPLSGYRFAGDHLAQAQSNWDHQPQNMGVLELNIDRIVPGGKEPLLLSLQEFEVPGRTMGKATLEYLNGRAQYLTAPEPLDDLTVTFRDYPDVGTRAILHRWFQQAFDEETGLSLPPSLLKTTGFCVLFKSDATAERVFRLEGVQPTQAPSIAVTYGTGEIMTMQIPFAIDRVIPESSVFNPASAAPTA